MSPDNSSSDHSGKYLSVVVAHESYALPVLRVREIIRLQKITPVPGMPGHVKGVINLRGRVIPITDLRVKFGAATEYTERTCIVVVQLGSGGLPMGLIVDGVEEVVNLTAAQIEPTPSCGVRVDTSYLLGVAKVGETVKFLLEIDRLVARDPAPAHAHA